MMALGHNRSGKPDGIRRIVVSFDVETFEQIRSRADRNRTSFAEEARTLLTWGLEAADG